MKDPYELECLDPDELVDFARTAEVLARYARCLGRAKRARLDGMIELAHRFESMCESYYKRLPEKEKW